MSVNAKRIQEPAIGEQLAKELEHHTGHWVAIHNDHVVATGDSAREAYQSALDTGIADPLMLRVPTHPRRIAFY